MKIKKIPFRANIGVLLTLIATTYSFANFTLTVTAENGGVTLSPSGGSYASGTQVTITPVPNSEYEFLNWGGVLAGTDQESDDPVVITMDANKTVIANFKLMDYGQNRALIKNITTSSVDSTFYPHYLADNDTGFENRFQSSTVTPGTLHWIEFEFEKSTKISEFKYWLGKGTAYDESFAAYTLKYWNGSSWVTFLNVTSEYDSIKARDLSPSVTTTKVRFENSACNTLEIYEMQFLTW